MTTFEAVLTVAIELNDIKGRALTLHPGQPILVSVLDTALVLDTVDARHIKVPKGTIVGSLGDNSFELSTEEFRAVNAVLSRVTA